MARHNGNDRHHQSDCSCNVTLFSKPNNEQHTHTHTKNTKLRALSAYKCTYIPNNSSDFDVYSHKFRLTLALKIRERKKTHDGKFCRFTSIIIKKTKEKRKKNKKQKNPLPIWG